ncbi:MAG: glycosyltransferase family 4 protein [Bacteroidales bacterium]|nr:glycosyltransferase family 4 protein [Bacteroidales bacterium]
MKLINFHKDIISHFKRSDISIFHDFVPPPTGGGHQFLRALQRYLTEINYSIENNSISPNTRACVFNSFNFDFNRLKRLRKKRPECLMLHRVDGPISTYRGFDDGTDKSIETINQELADLTIFQSNYSIKAHLQLGMTLKEPHILIQNTPDPLLFNPLNREKFRHSRKTRIISTSWSDNPNKGLETYRWLDANLNWTRYEYLFIGRIKTDFQNIRHIPPVDPTKLANYLRESDIFITASLHDPCSNSLLESLACGLPVLYVNSGGHGELVKDAGLSFTDPSEIPALLEQMINRYSTFQRLINIPTLDHVAHQYLRAMNILD